MGATPVRLKSACCQIAYWDSGTLRIANYLTGRTFAAEPVTLEVIRFFCIPRTIREALVRFRSYSRGSVAEAIVGLIDAQLLLEPGSAAWQRDRLVESSWRRWLPEGAFHFMTKDTPYVPADWSIEAKLATLPATKAPPQFKRIPGVRSIPLPASGVDTDTFFQTLHARRTHRDFAQDAVSLTSVAKLIQTTWGVQGFFQAPGFGKLPYKTSPSGGARQPIEVYLMALNVRGLKRGLYHYEANAHRLARLSGKASPQRASAFCGDQPYFAGAAALFIMTAVFARTLWKYGRARAYRVILLEAGHLGQTFCLTATRMGLAPFSTAALNDSLVEKELGIDGISESVIYITGVGIPSRRATPVDRS